MKTEFPVALGPAADLGIFDSSFTVMAWVYSDASVSDTEDYAIVGSDTLVANKALHLMVCLLDKRT